MEKIMNALDKRGITYHALANGSFMSGTMIHSTIGYEIEFLIQYENGIYTLIAWCNNNHLETIGRKTPKAIVDNMESILKGLPRRLDGIRMTQWEESMEFYNVR